MHNNLEQNKRTFTDDEIDDLAAIVLALKQLTKKDIVSCSKTVGDCVEASFSQRLMIERKAFNIEAIRERS